MNNKPNGKITRVELELWLDQLRDAVPVLVQQATPQAKVLRAKYLALIAEGFNEKDALQIVCSRPIIE